MNKGSVRFDEFIQLFRDHISSIIIPSSDGYNKERIEFTLNNLEKDFMSLFIGNPEDIFNGMKTFFTTDQSLSPDKYRPTNQNYNKNYEYVFSGCSQTQGHFLTPPLVSNGSHEDLWGFQISKKYNKEALNLAIGGYSAQSILKGIMHHFRKNGNSKVLLVLYPDFGRWEFVNNNKIKHQKPLNDYEFVQHFYLQPSDDIDFNKISKVLHNPTDVLPWTQSFYQNLQSILFLDTYCKNSGIYFKYSTWDYSSHLILKILKNNLPEYYSNFIEQDFFNYGDFGYTYRDPYFKNFNKQSCHDNNMLKTSEIWEVGSDKAHIGLHHHIHIAEQFMKEIDNDNPWN